MQLSRAHKFATSQPAAKHRGLSRAAMATSGLGLLASAYGDDDDDDAAAGGSAAAPAASSVTTICAAPQVTDDMPRGHEGGHWDAIKPDASKRGHVLYQNPVYEEMWAPQQGPSMTAHEQRAAGIKAKNHFQGNVAQYHPSSE